MKLFWSSLLCTILVTISSAQDPVIAWQKHGHNQCDLFVVSADGKRLGTSSTKDVTVKLWDIETGKHLGTGGFATYYKDLFPPAIDTLAITPHGSQAEGSTHTFFPYYRVTAYTEPRTHPYIDPSAYKNMRRALLWDELRTLFRYDSLNGSTFVLLDDRGKQLKRWFLNQKNLKKIITSPDTVHFAVFNSEKGEVIFSDINTGIELNRIKGPTFIHDGQFSLDGNYFVAETDTNVIRVWDWRSGTLVHSLQLEAGPRILSNDWSHVVQNYKVFRTYDGAHVYTLDDSAGYHQLAVAHNGSSLHLIYQHPHGFDTTGQLQIRSIGGISINRQLFPTVGRASALAFAEGSQYLVSAHGTLLRLWDVHTRAMLQELDVETPIATLSTSVDGKNIFIGYDQARDIQRYETATLSLKHTYHPALGLSGRCVYLKECTNGKLYATFANDTNLYIYHALSGSFLERKAIPINGVSSGGYDITSDGNRIAIGGRDSATVFEIATMNVVKEISYGDNIYYGYLSHARYAKDDSRLFLGWNSSDFVEAWSYAHYNIFSLSDDSMMYPYMLGGGDGTLAKCEWNREGNRIYAVSANIDAGNSNRLGAFFQIGVDSGTGKSFSMPSAQQCLAVSQDSTEYIATAGADGTISLWCTKDCSLGVSEEKRLDASIKLYPNPSYEFITLTIERAFPQQPLVRVFDILGHEVEVGIEVLSANEIRLDTRGLVSGIYVLHSVLDPLFSVKFVKVDKY